MLACSPDELYVLCKKEKVDSGRTRSNLGLSSEQPKPSRLQDWLGVKGPEYGMRQIICLEGFVQ